MLYINFQYLWCGDVSMMTVADDFMTCQTLTVVGICAMFGAVWTNSSFSLYFVVIVVIEIIVNHTVEWVGLQILINSDLLCVKWVNILHFNKHLFDMKNQLLWN